MISATGNKQRSSFTFIELIFIIAIIAALVAVAIPSFRKSFYNIHLNNFTGQLREFISYVSQRAVSEEKILVLEIDSERKEYFAREKDTSVRIRTYSIPREIEVTIAQDSINFYPDASIDKKDIHILSADGQEIILTTEGVYSGAKIKE
ncbi:MAG: hypothetical protein AB1481_06090 [Candidatus Omnitrophota bacterium]